MPDQVVISDTSCLILLTSINEVELLNKLYSRVFTTPEIIEEFGDPLPDWIETVKAKDSNLQKALELQIDTGEASAIALSFEIAESTLILDDLKARKVASHLNRRYTGTLGVLGKAKSEGFVPELKPLIIKLLETNFRISQKVISELLKRHGEED